VLPAHSRPPSSTLSLCPLRTTSTTSDELDRSTTANCITANHKLFDLLLLLLLLLRRLPLPFSASHPSICSKPDEFAPHSSDPVRRSTRRHATPLQPFTTAFFFLLRPVSKQLVLFSFTRHLLLTLLPLLVPCSFSREQVRLKQFPALLPFLRRLPSTLHCIKAATTCDVVRFVRERSTCVRKEGAVKCDEVLFRNKRADKKTRSR
jgi:hypothetical protein